MKDIVAMNSLKKLSRRQRQLIRVVIGAVIFAGLFVVEHLTEPLFDTWWQVALAAYLVPYIVLGLPVLLDAARGVRSGHMFDENFLMSVATIGAFALGEYPEAVAVMCFYEIGQLFESYAVDKSRDNIAALMDICPETANLEVDGQLKTVDPYKVEIGSIICVKPGERVPLDGIVEEGESQLDTSALTGESLPRAIVAGQEIISGAINLSGTLRVRTTKEFEDSTVSRILELVENAASEKAPTEAFITRFARYYTPIVCGLALAIAILPPLFTGFNFASWIERGLIFLVVSCPCALVISVPLSFFGGIGGASRKGILIKGSTYLESLSKVDTMLFDKTGTLTKGSFEVSRVVPSPKTDMKESQLLELAALAESYSNHPIAISVREAWQRFLCGEQTPTDATDAAVAADAVDESGTSPEETPILQGSTQLDLQRVSDAEEISGRGIKCSIDGHVVLAGNDKLMHENGVEIIDTSEQATVLHIARDGGYLGRIEIKDVIKEDTAVALAQLEQCGVTNRVMLTGDRQEVAAAISAEVGISEYHAELLPEGKIEYLKRYLQRAHKADKAGKKHAVAFVGDGINDAPALMLADVGIAMGALGSDAAIEAADIVLMDDSLSHLGEAMRISRSTMRIVWQNIVFALGVKIIILLLAALGLANMWLAIFGDVGVTVIAILNAMRALRVV